MLQAEGVEVAPAVLEADPCADIDQRQVVVEDVLLKRDGDDQPRSGAAGENEEPGETDRAQVAPRAAVAGYWLAPLGERYGFSGFRPDVLRLRADEAVVDALLQHVCRPARHARHREGRGKVLLRQSDS